MPLPSPEAVAAGRINLRQLEKNATELMDSILRGKAGFSSKSACETAFGDLADAFVAERVGRFAEVDALDDLPQATKDAIKTQLVSFDKVKGIDPGCTSTATWRWIRSGCRASSSRRATPPPAASRSALAAPARRPGRGRP